MKKCWLVLLMLFMSGCSSKLAYNNLNWLIYWYMDDYVELNDQQEAIFDKRLEQWIDWHRSEEMPRYIAHLNAVRNDLNDDSLTESRLLSHYEKATAHWQRLRAEITPELANMAQKLSDEQVIRLFAALEKDNKESESSIKEIDEKSPEEQAKQRIEDLREDMSSRIGALTDEQKAIIDRFAPTFKRSSRLWLDYRRDLQRRARALFANRENNPDFVDDLTALMMNPEQYRSPEFLDVWNNNRTQHAKLAAEISQTLTAKQKRKLVAQIDDMISDLEDLLDD